MNTDINQPTLLVNIERVRRNIVRMAEKSRRQGIRFRPHFKTHQSAIIGDYFRDIGITAITVSSVSMAEYFSRHGWNDITIAFPANLRQISAINDLAKRINLGILVENLDTVEFLSNHLNAPVDVWIEIDEGSQRSGISWEHPELVSQLAKVIGNSSMLRIKGLLTHPGRIYRAGTTAEIEHIYHEAVSRINNVRQFLANQDFNLEVSVGDTPGCTICNELGPVDEIRPGNFVFYDAVQLALGVCKLEDIAAILACPIVARYPQRHELIIYGGAVHLSKDTVIMNGHVCYGLVVSYHDGELETGGHDWISLIKGGYVDRLTQEHGVVALPNFMVDHVKVGELLYLIPAHVCLTVSALGRYTTTNGQIIPTLNMEVENVD